MIIYCRLAKMDSMNEGNIPGFPLWLLLLIRCVPVGSTTGLYILLSAPEKEALREEAKCIRQELGESGIDIAKLKDEIFKLSKK